MKEEMVSVKEEITSLLLSDTAEDSCTVHATVQDTGTVMYTYNWGRNQDGEYWEYSRYDLNIITLTFLYFQLG